LTTESDEKDKTAPLELPHPPPPASAPPHSASVEPGGSLAPPPGVLLTEPGGAADSPIRPALVARPANGAQQDVMFVPLAVSIGDGFKFGCGFFLALVLALLVGFVLLALLFVLTSLFGLNLPISR
jgi:hypothetical protein